MIDSHTHLDRGPAPAAELVAAARAAGVTRILTIGMDSQSCRAALAAAESFPQVRVSVGRHPNSASGFDDADLAELRALAAHDACVAIVSSSAARVWITSGLPSSRASSIWARNARSWSARGA